jgi:acyl phosphate:glycerol-3-phosphate acyltransferase
MPVPENGGSLLPLAIAAAAGYLLGSLPFGAMVARSRGVDIFSVGSRSPGATNVRRVLGTGPGNAVLFLDILKGAVAAGWPLLFGWTAIGSAPSPRILGYVGLAAALIGHSFSCFTGFRGGKGVATAAGGLVVLMPYVAVSAAALWGILFVLSRYVSLASIIAAASLPVFAFAYRQGTIAMAVSGLIALFVVVRHRANITRLLNGTEKRVERKKAGAAPAGGKP